MGIDFIAGTLELQLAWIGQRDLRIKDFLGVQQKVADLVTSEVIAGY